MKTLDIRGAPHVLHRRRRPRHASGYPASRRVRWTARRILCKRRGVSSQETQQPPELFSPRCKTASDEWTRFSASVRRDRHAYYHHLPNRERRHSLVCPSLNVVWRGIALTTV